MGDATMEPSPEKKMKIFSCQAFRQDIKGNEALKSLKKFVSAAKNSDDVVYEYLEGGGSLHEILSLIDLTAKGDLTTALPVFEVVHLILLSFQSSDSKFHQHCVEGARIILRSHMLTIKAMLSMNIAKQKKVALKLLTAIVTLNSSFASEIMNVISLTPTMITELIQPTSDKESVRKNFILFILSFLIDGNATVLKNILDKKGYISSIIPGLKFDEASTVNLTLSLLEDKVLKNSKISKTIKLKIFNTQIIKSLFDLYDWKGPQSTIQLIPKKKNKRKEVEVNEKEKDLVVESIHSFLLLLCCSKRHGIAFFDKSMGTSEQLNNQLLLTVFESLSDPLKNKKVSEVLLKTIASCPDLMKPILLKLEPFFQPRNSKNWFDAIEFAEDLIKELDAASLLKSENEVVTTSQIIKVARGLCSPVVFLRVGKSGAEKTHPVEIRLASLKLTTTMWGEIQKLLSAFPKHDLKKPMTHHVSKFLPDAEDLVELWHNLCDGEFVRNQSFLLTRRSTFLSVVLTSLQVIVECQAGAVSSPLSLASDMLKHIEKEEMNDDEFNDIQVKIVQFVAMDLQSLIPTMDLFEKSLCILLRSFTNDSISLASKILSSTGVFKVNESEVDVWLFCCVSLPMEYREEIAECLIKSLRRFFDNKNNSGYLNGLAADELEPEFNTEATITPLIFECLETLKAHSSDSPKKSSKPTAFQRYLSDVIIHLQHFYTIDFIFYDRLKSFKKIISKTVINYLKNWKHNTLTPVDVDVFSCPQQLDLIAWLLNEDDSRNIGDVITVEKSDIFKLYSLFRVVVAYFINKSAGNGLSDGDVPKYADSLLFFIKIDEPLEEDDDQTAEVISHDLKNRSIFYKNSVDCLFSNSHLLNAFDIFSKKSKEAYHSTTLVIKVLMGNETVKNYLFNRNVMEPWKSRFLKQIKSKLKKNKSVDGVDDLELVLNFFDYSHSDAGEVIDLLVASDLSLFVHKTNPSMWTVILVKFIKIHCLKEELEEEVIKKLCLIMEHLSQENCHLEVIDDCFVYLLRKHPRHLLLIENGFLEMMLKRTNITPTTSTLGKLLLNDPSKVKHFLSIVTKNWESFEESELIFSLLSVLLMDEDIFLETIKSESVCLVWKISEIREKSSSKLLKVLQLVYQKFGKEIVRAMAGESVEMISKNMDMARVFISLFLDKKDTKKLKNVINKGLFEPELLLEAVKKLDVKTITESFVLGLLAMFSRTIKSTKNADEEVLWSKYCSVVGEVMELNKNSPWEQVPESPEWREFAKLALGYCFGSSKYPSLLKILRLLSSTIFKSKEESKSSILFFQMLISHSQFLNVILGKSPLKGELVELFYNLIEINPSQMSPKHVPILLASYTAGLSRSDETLLRILRLYEKSGVGVSDYEPFVWGETAVSHYSIGSNPGLSLWQRFSMTNVLDLLDSQRMELSLKEFPIHRSLEGNHSTVSDSNAYDPAFLLPLFVNLLSPGSVVFCLPFIYKGALGYTVRALSSECSDVRMAASVVLTRFYNHLQMSQNLKQKLVWMHFINCFRYGIKDLSTQRLPNITTLFFARMTLELSRHPAEMYLPLQNFLLAKTYFGFETIPEFLPLFHSSEVSYWKHREWLLQVLRDGCKTSLDLNLIFHSMALKVIFCFFQSQLCDNETKKLILQVMERILSVEKSILIISEYSLLNWINSIDCKSYPVVLYDLVKLLSVSKNVIIQDIKTRKCKHTSLSHIIQVLNIAVKFLPALKTSKSIDIFKIYIKMIFDCLVLFINKDESYWFKLNRNRLQEVIDTGTIVLGGSYDCRKFCKVRFYFRDYDENYDSDVVKDFKNSVFLFNMLADKETDKEVKL